MDINTLKIKFINSKNIKKKIYYLSLILLLKKKKKINISKSNIIYLLPNYKHLVPNQNIDKTNYDYAFIYNKKENKYKLINNIDTKTFIKFNYKFLIIIKNTNIYDNLILIIKLPNLSKIKNKLINNNLGGFNNTFNTIRESGNGFDINNVGGKNTYKAPIQSISKLSSNLDDYDSKNYPADELFGSKKIEGLIEQEKNDYKNYEKGFANGFDNGYNKGYYFGYSAASAYLYRFYKKYYSDYMSKYKLKLDMLKVKNKENLLDEINKKYETEFNENDIDNVELEENNVIEETKISDSEKTDNTSESNEIKEFKNVEQNAGNISTLFSNNYHYDLKLTNNKDLYEGLPDYMRPENLMNLESLKPEEGIFGYINNILNPPPPPLNPRRHCYKPKKEELDKMLKQYFIPIFRDAVVGINKNWDQKFFEISCNKTVLRNMKYCPHENHSGIEFDLKTGKYFKACKLKKDNEKNICIIS